MARLILMLALTLLPAAAWAAAPDGRSAQAQQHGAQPDPQAVRPGSPQGDAPSDTAGALVRQHEARRILGLPVAAALTIAAVLIVLVVLAGVAIPRARRQARARGDGTYGRP
jgi:hypothetical protein